MVVADTCNKTVILKIQMASVHKLVGQSCHCLYWQFIAVRWNKFHNTDENKTLVDSHRLLLLITDRTPQKYPSSIQLFMADFALLNAIQSSDIMYLIS